MDKFELKYPLKRDDNSETTELPFRRMTFADMEALNKAKSALDASRIAITRLCEISADEVGRLDVHDFNRLDEIVADFLDDGKKKEEKT